ncbi:sensor histidine kinase [Macellibacteroides fermentans]|jgi:nitrogen fixation/metabolism regulation signal transduction histidine kinase|uniref:sensor histidine kinase n=1 Tax=Macellibacteroides fermentans TaxID=879969 RepID=UPI000AB6D0EB
MKRLLHTVFFKIIVTLLCCAALTSSILLGEFLIAIPIGILFIISCRGLYLQYLMHARQVIFMLNAIENDDFSFKFSSDSPLRSDILVNQTLNRITAIIQKAKVDAVQKEKYYELILNSVNTGIIVADENGNIFQTNNEALKLLGLSVFTHLKQLYKISPDLPDILQNVGPGEKQQTSFVNERGTVHLSVRTSKMVINNTKMCIYALNDINSELDDKEIESWIRLTRVLTHEIMNSITPITSLSETLLSLHKNANKDIRNGLEVISSTGKGLIDFVESYRKFTHLPTPQPSLFYAAGLAERIKQLTQCNNTLSGTPIIISIEPHDLIIHADEKLITQVMLNLVKNAMQSIGNAADGLIQIKGYCNPDESVSLEIMDNGPGISPEMADHIFIPFFTTKEGGSGIGLSISRQIMRLHGGTLTLKSSPLKKETAFILTFK